MLKTVDFYYFSPTGGTKKAITAVVYGVRAYEDALIELNDIMKNSGFEVIASAALIAQHSIVSEVGAGRPNQADIAEIQKYAKHILNAIEDDKTGSVTVPGNRPYKESMKASVTPISLSMCSECGYCVLACPTEAISLTSDGVVTDIEKCMMCMTCVAKCPTQSRILPPQHQAGIAEKLSIFKDVHRKNEFF